MIELNKATKQFEELSVSAESSPENQRNHEELQQRYVRTYVSTIIMSILRSMYVLYVCTYIIH